MAENAKAPKQSAGEPKRKRKRTKLPGDTLINMTPMIDVVFQLIIFFMLVAEMSKMEIEAVTLPFALQAVEDPPNPEDRIVVNVVRDGRIIVMRQTLTPEDLADLLKRRAQHSTLDQDGLPTTTIKIRSDAEAEYEYPQIVMAKAMEAKIWRLSFGVNPVSQEDMINF